MNVASSQPSLLTNYLVFESLGFDAAGRKGLRVGSWPFKKKNGFGSNSNNAMSAKKGEGGGMPGVMVDRAAGSAGAPSS